MNVTLSLYALSVYNNALVEMLNERIPMRRTMLQLILNLSLELHILESIKEAKAKPPKPCDKCHDSGYRQAYYLNVGRVFPEPCDCKAGMEVRTLKRKTERDLIELGDRLPY